MPSAFDLLAAIFALASAGVTHAPHLGERVHVEGHVVHLALAVGDGAVHVVVELGELGRRTPQTSCSEVWKMWAP